MYFFIFIFLITKPSSMSPVNTVIDQIYDNSLCFAESFWMEMGTMEEKTFSHLP